MYDNTAQGEMGDKGDKGDDGVGISSVVIDKDSNLVITLTDGTTHNAGSVVGPGGAIDNLDAAAILQYYAGLIG